MDQRTHGVHEHPTGVTIEKRGGDLTPSETRKGAGGLHEFDVKEVRWDERELVKATT